MGKSDPFGSPRDPRPKGSQKDTVCRDKGGPWDAVGSGCLMTLLLLPALPVLALMRRIERSK